MSYNEDKIVSLERQILLWSIAKASIHNAPENLKKTDDFQSVSNYMDKLKKDLKRKLSALQKNDKSS